MAPLAFKMIACGTRFRAPGKGSKRISNPHKWSGCTPRSWYCNRTPPEPQPTSRTSQFDRFLTLFFLKPDKTSLCSDCILNKCAGEKYEYSVSESIRVSRILYSCFKRFRSLIFSSPFLHTISTFLLSLEFLKNPLLSFCDYTIFLQPFFLAAPFPFLNLNPFVNK